MKLFEKYFMFTRFFIIRSAFDNFSINAVIQDKKFFLDGVCELVSAHSVIFIRNR